MTGLADIEAQQKADLADWRNEVTRQLSCVNCRIKASDSMTLALFIQLAYNPGSLAKTTELLIVVYACPPIITAGNPLSDMLNKARNINMMLTIKVRLIPVHTLQYIQVGSGLI